MRLGLGMIRHPNFSFSRCIFGLWLARGHYALQSLLPKAEEDAMQKSRPGSFSYFQHLIVHLLNILCTDIGKL